MRSLVVILSLMILILVSPLVEAAEIRFITEKQLTCVLTRIDIELKLNAVYVWGAAGLEPGAPGDCTGKAYAIFSS
jgi:hypothetical protein